MKTKSSYSGMLSKGDTTTLIGVPADCKSEMELSARIGYTCTVVEKLVSSPPHCTLWYYVSFGEGPWNVFPVTRDMIK
jgi:uncharacterized protein YaaQ